jgi:hypothetical protein
VALKITNTAGYGSIAAPSGQSSSNWSLVLNSKLTTYENDGWIFRIATAAGSFGLMAYGPGNNWLPIVSGSYATPTNAVDPLASYATFAIVYNAPDVFLYHVLSGTATLIYSATPGAGIAATSIEVGGSLNYLGLNSALASHSHAKYWKATSLTSGEVITESTAAEPVKAGATHCWKMADATDPSPDFLSVGALDLATGAYYTSDTDPGYVVAGSSSAPMGVIRPRQQFAFSSAIARHS